MRVRFDKNADSVLKQSCIYIIESSNNKGKWKNIFENSNPIYLEIGMGKGNFIISMAKRFPDYNFIGMERNKTILSKALKKIEKEKITNIRLISNDAKELKEIFDYGEISKIFLNFSDPWIKSKHYKRRLTYKDYLDIYDDILQVNGITEFKTDNQILFEFTITQICNTNRYIEYISLDLHKTDEFNIMTEYEEKFSAKGNRIYKMNWRNKRENR